LGGRGRQISEFEANLVFRVSSRITQATQGNPVSKKKKKKIPKREEKNNNNMTLSVDSKIVSQSYPARSAAGSCLGLQGGRADAKLY
jgi:hypothetical protein